MQLNRLNNFDQVVYNEPVIASYSFKNIGNNTLNIKSVNPACIFHKYEIDQKSIEPGEIAKLMVHFIPSFTGYIKEYIIIETDTPERFYSFVFEAVVE